MATTVLGLKTFTASDPVDYNEVNDNYNKIDNGVKTAMQGRAAQNLLDNSDFTNPVNQRGATSWTAHGIYCIDRWKTESESNAANISYTAGSGITLTPSSTNYAGIIQQFENYSSMTGKVYTIAICVNNVWYSGTFTMGATPSGGVVLSNGIRIYSASGYNVLIRNPAGQSAITIQRAALYEGSYTADTLPAYQPKGYAAELAECQRLFRRGSVSLPCINGTTLITGYAFQTKMRINPTYTIMNLKSWTSDGFTDISKNISSIGVNQEGVSYIEVNTAFEKPGLILLSADFSADL